jgi:hypothetical protein
MAVSAIQNGAYSFLEKPFDPRRLIKLLENASQLRRLTRNADRLKARLAELSGLDRVMIGNAPSIKALRAEIADLSTTDANVMLAGRDRHRQGTGGKGAARPGSPVRGAVRAAELRGGAGGEVRGDAVRHGRERPRACWRRRRVARCSSTNSARFRWKSRPSCCV